LIRLYERAVGFYGSLINVNADTNPGRAEKKRDATVAAQKQLSEKLVCREGKTRKKLRVPSTQIGNVFHCWTFGEHTDPTSGSRLCEPSETAFQSNKNVTVRL